MDLRKSAIIAFSVLGTIAVLAGCKNLPVKTSDENSADTQQKVIARSMQLAGPESTAKRPLNWPSNKVWKPMRHFGPFQKKSRFEEIQILLKQQFGQNPQWYFNNFFEFDLHKRIYRKYFQNSVLPTIATSATPQQDYIPGKIPASGVTNFGDDDVASTDILFELHQIRYSSRYGGSVEFRFQATEDYEYELRRGSKLWDIQSMDLLVYTHLKAESFNPIPFNSNFFNAPVYAELRPRVGQAYDIDSDSKIRASQDQSETSLNIALQTIADAIASHVKQSANQFAYGFVHTQFQNALPYDSTDKVTKVLLKENYLDLHFTHRYPVFTLRARLGGIYALGSDLFDTARFYGYLWVNHKYKGKTDEWHIVHFPGGSGTIESTGSTYWLPLGNWSLDECQYLERITVEITLLEDDDLSNDDLFSVDPHVFVFEESDAVQEKVDFVIDCAAIQNAHQQQKYGVLDGHEYMDLNLLYDSDGDYQWGNFVWSSRLEVWVR